MRQRRNLQTILIILMFCILASLTYAHDYGTIEYYPFDVDGSSQNGSDLGATGSPTHIPMIVGDGFEYTTNIYYSNSTWIDPSSIRTMEIILNKSADGFFLDIESGSTNKFFIGYNVHSGPNLEAHLVSGGAPYKWELDAPITSNSLYHVIVKMGDGAAELYVNGSLIERVEDGTVMSSNWNTITVGYFGSGTGSIDNLAFFEENYSLADIAYAYNSYAGRNYSAITIPDLEPPWITNITCTSADPDDEEEPYITADNTPTFNFTTNKTATCGISDSNGSYTTCATTGVKGEHICTEPNPLNLGDSFVYLNCTDSSANSAYEELNVTIVGNQIQLDGVNASRKYEYGTVANLTMITNFTTCLDILDGSDRYYNYSCGNNYNYTIDKLYEILWNDTVRYRNLTPALNLTGISIDNRTWLVEMLINLTGYDSGGYPEDLEIDLNNDSILDAIIPGLIVNNTYQVYKFSYLNSLYQNLNITFSTAGEAIIFMNITTAGNFSRNGTLNFTVTAFDLDADNALDYQQNMSTKLDGGENETTIDGEFDVNSVYDDFYSNDTFYKYVWTNLEIQEGLHYTDTSKNGINLSNCISGEDDPFFGLNRGKECLIMDVSNLENNQYVNDVYPDINLRDINQLDMQLWIHLEGSGTGTGDIEIGFYGDGNEQFEKIFDENIILTGSYNREAHRATNYSIWWSDPNTLSYSFCFSQEAGGNFGCNDGTKNVAGLNGSIRLLFHQYIDDAQGLTNRIEIHKLNISGISLNRTNGSYSIPSTNWTRHIYTAPTDIQRAKIIWKEVNKNFTVDNSTTLDSISDLHVFLSNGQETWNQVLNDTFYSFDTVGNNLSLSVIINTTNDLVSPILSDYQILIIPTGGSDLEVDVGETGFVDMDVGISLNSSTTPIYYNGTDNGIINYKCGDVYQNLTCLIPIKLTVNQTSQIEISAFNYTKNFNPINLTNLTSVEDKSNFTLRFNFTKGILMVTQALEFFGSKNVTVTAFEQSDRSNNLTHVIQVRYSHYNLTVPSGQPYWAIYPNHRNQSDIEPYGQNEDNGFWKVLSQAYEDTFNIFVKYNETVESCIANMTFTGNYTNCLQETANETNGCGLNTGNYSVEQNWKSGGSNTFDGDYSTYDNGSITVGWLKINYTKPINSTNSSLWQVKDGNNTINLSIPYDCWNNDPLDLFLVSSLTQNEMFYYCYNETGSAYSLMLTRGPNNDFYEESMWWDINQSYSIELNTSHQFVLDNMFMAKEADIYTYTDIACGGSGNTKPYNFSYFCFRSRCTDCVETIDWGESCDWIE